MEQNQIFYFQLKNKQLMIDIHKYTYRNGLDSTIIEK